MNHPRGRMAVKKHPLYLTWRGIITRCNNSNHEAYHRYGGRGIKVIWSDFWSFVNDIERECGEKPTSQHTLDRIDTNGNYEPGNMRWATKSEQSINQKKSSKNTSGYMGVWWRSNRNCWVAQIYVNHQRIIIGHFRDLIEAGKAYDEAARKYHGDLAKQNFS